MIFFLVAFHACRLCHRLSHLSRFYISAFVSHLSHSKHSLVKILCAVAFVSLWIHLDFFVYARHPSFLSLCHTSTRTLKHRVEIFSQHNTHFYVLDIKTSVRSLIFSHSPSACVCVCCFFFCSASCFTLCITKVISVSLYTIIISEIERPRSSVKSASKWRKRSGRRKERKNTKKKHSPNRIHTFHFVSSTNAVVTLFI